MDADQNDLINYLIDVEKAAEEILADKEQVVDLDRKRNQVREAQRSLEHDMKSRPWETKTWMCVGNMFIKVPKAKALSIVKDDQKEFDQEINNLRNGLKTKVDNLRKIEGKTPLKGFDLKALSKEEAQTLENVLTKT